MQTDSEGCAAGAAGAVLGHLAAEWIDDGTRSNADITNFARLIAGLGGALVAMHTDGDAQSVTIAPMAGENAAANNYLRHVEAQRLADLKFRQLQGKCDQACSADIQRLEMLDKERNKFLAACEGSNSSQCQAARQDVRVAAAEYIRAIDPDLDLRALQERDETLLLARNTMGGTATGDIVGGYLDTLREGIESLVGGAQKAMQALMGDPQAQAALREARDNSGPRCKTPSNGRTCWAR
ncbi:DUF6862 domain-containing protein [Hydrogenophaga sp. BPS33]|uniref:DUF6862 domain-containing protein n=1 Tax=Hydrogenophaga sp. BPS33 TaxID=2651974 RepID=UPI0013592E36|nr:VENN motif pre-toxin domain-containing protein [Hydrogenophaga sp. BPS33]